MCDECPLADANEVLEHIFQEKLNLPIRYRGHTLDVSWAVVQRSQGRISGKSQVSRCTESLQAS